MNRINPDKLFFVKSAGNIVSGFVFDTIGMKLKENVLCIVLLFAEPLILENKSIINDRW